MRFQNQLQFPLPTPPANLALLRAPTTEKGILQTTSGKSGWIILPGPAHITLLTLILSWSNIQVAGQLNISGASPEPLFSVLQTKADDIEIIDCHELPAALNEYGLRSANNSIGGNYSVTVLYRRA